MTYAEARTKDPAIRDIILMAASRNVAKIDIEAIEKILCEGADGRFLVEIPEEYYPVIFPEE